MTKDWTELESYLYRENLEIEYDAVFVPFSRSCNAKQIKSLTDYTINWKVTISTY